MGSFEYTPLTFVALTSKEAPISNALRVAAESVVKKGLPVPPANSTGCPLDTNERANRGSKGKTDGATDVGAIT